MVGLLLTVTKGSLTMKKVLLLAAMFVASCQHDCPQPEKVEVPTPPVCEADKTSMDAMAKLQSELAQAKTELGQAKAALEAASKKPEKVKEKKK
jgi:hypothetical protein